MIIKDFQIGKHTCVFAEFGTGDIMMNNGHALDEIATDVYLTNTRPGVIGDLPREEHDYKGKTTEALPSIDIMLRFTRPESIDVLIKSLEQAKKELIELQHKSFEP